MLDAAHIPLRCLGRVEVQRIARAADHRRRLRERPGYRQCQDQARNLALHYKKPADLICNRQFFKRAFLKRIIRIFFSPYKIEMARQRHDDILANPDDQAMRFDEPYGRVI